MIIILCGKSGCGKDTMLNKLVLNDGMTPVISTTSRPMRENEQNGREYNFVTKEEFLQKISNDEFIEYRTYTTKVKGKDDIWYYGSPKINPLSANFVVVLDIDGARSYTEHYGKENCCIVLIDVPDDVREMRARRRGSFDPTEWNRRVSDDALKFNSNITDKLVDIKIENGNTSPETTYNVLKTAIKQYLQQKTN